MRRWRDHAGRSPSGIGGMAACGALCLVFGLIEGLPASARAMTDPQVHVEAIVYSGRPNPAWDLSASESADFVSRIDALPATAGSGAPDGLGYSGLDVTVRRAGEVRHLRINAGLAQIKEGHPKVRSDAKRSLELWLLRTGRGSLDPGLLEYLESSVASRE